MSEQLAKKIINECHGHTLKTIVEACGAALYTNMLACESAEEVLIANAVLTVGIGDTMRERFRIGNPDRDIYFDINELRGGL